MICSFKIVNYLSFRHEAVIEFYPEPLKEKKEYLHIPYLYDIDLRLHKSLAIYGHNSFGKSNILKAYKFFVDSIFKSFVFGSTDNFFDHIDNFALNTESKEMPTKFEIVFIVKEIKYRYAFEVLNGKVIKEELWYAKSKIRENYLYQRENEEIRISALWSKDNKESGKIIEHSRLFTKHNHLFLSVLFSQKNISAIDQIYNWFKSNIFILNLNDKEHLERATMMLSQVKYRSTIQKFIKNADLGFTTIIDKIDSYSNNILGIDKGIVNLILTHELKSFDVFVEHSVFKKDYTWSHHEVFELLKRESAGSIKYLILASYLTMAIKEGLLIWIDEMDAQLHKHLFDSLIKIYNDAKINVNGSQMVFTTHSVSLLADKTLRRDQPIFVSKNKFGESNISKQYTKSNPLRIDTPYDKKYLTGEIGVSQKLKNNEEPLEFDF